MGEEVEERGGEWKEDEGGDENSEIRLYTD